MKMGLKNWVRKESPERTQLSSQAGATGFPWPLASIQNIQHWIFFSTQTDQVICNTQVFPQQLWKCDSYYLINNFFLFAFFFFFSPHKKDARGAGM